MKSIHISVFSLALAGAIIVNGIDTVVPVLVLCVTAVMLEFIRVLFHVSKGAWDARVFGQAAAVMVVACVLVEWSVRR